MITAIVVDDVKIIRDTVVRFLEQYPDEITVVAEANSVTDAIAKVTNHQPDAIFLDVELKDGTAFDLLKQLDIKKYKIVFITAYDHYAVKAFKFSAVDYLLKPIDPDELKVAIGKLKDAIAKETIEAKFNTLFSNLQSSEQATKKIILKTLGNTYSVYIKDIIRCEADNNYTRFYLADNKKILVSITLKEYEELLSEHQFFRIHQSHLINLHFFDHIKDGISIVIKDGSILPLASRKKNTFIKLIQTVKWDKP